MNVYYYTPEEAGLGADFAPGYFRLGGFDEVLFVDVADVFVLPTDIRHVTDKQILALPHLKGNEARHVFFSLSEFPDRPLPVTEALGFRTDHNERLARYNPNVMTWCWGVEDLSRYIAPPKEGFHFDVHAQMWASTPTSALTVQSCEGAGLRVHNSLNNFFYGTLETAEDERLPELRRTFLESMQRSRLVLVPRSRLRVNRYRFYEALSMGRVPVLIGDGVTLPFPDSPTWEQCMLRVWEHEAHNVGALLRYFLEHISDEELRVRGWAGRELWETCLKNEVWEEVWGECVAKQLNLKPVKREVFYVS